MFVASGIWWIEIAKNCSLCLMMFIKKYQVFSESTFRIAAFNVSIPTCKDFLYEFEFSSSKPKPNFGRERNKN